MNPELLDALDGAVFDGFGEDVPVFPKGSPAPSAARAIFERAQNQVTSGPDGVEAVVTVDLFRFRDGEAALPFVRARSARIERTDGAGYFVTGPDPALSGRRTLTVRRS